MALCQHAQKPLSDFWRSGHYRILEIKFQDIPDQLWIRLNKNASAVSCTPNEYPWVNASAIS